MKKVAQHGRGWRRTGTSSMQKKYWYWIHCSHENPTRIDLRHRLFQIHRTWSELNSVVGQQAVHCGRLNAMFERAAKPMTMMQSHCCQEPWSCRPYRRQSRPVRNAHFQPSPSQPAPLRQVSARTVPDAVAAWLLRVDFGTNSSTHGKSSAPTFP